MTKSHHHKRLVGYDYEEKNGIYFIYEILELVPEKGIPEEVIKVFYRKTSSLKVARRVSGREEPLCLSSSEL